MSIRPIRLRWARMSIVIFQQSRLSKLSCNCGWIASTSKARELATIREGLLLIGSEAQVG